MPYITHSRNNPQLLSYCTRMGRLFGSCVVQRRGSKSLEKTMIDARSKGFSKIIIIGKSSTGGAAATLIKTHKAGGYYSILSKYVISKSGAGMVIKGKHGATDGKKNIVEEATD